MVKKYYSNSFFRKKLNAYLGGKKMIYIFVGNADAETVKTIVKLFNGLTPKWKGIALGFAFTSLGVGGGCYGYK